MGFGKTAAEVVIFDKKNLIFPIFPKSLKYSDRLNFAIVSVVIG